jgi:hypothetical protein
MEKLITGRSLYDVLRFYAVHYSEAMAYLDKMVFRLDVHTTPWEDIVVPTEESFIEVRDELRSALLGLVPHVKALPLSAAVKDQFKRLNDYVDKSRLEDARGVIALVDDFHAAFIKDFNEDVLVVVPRDKWPLYEPIGPLFGDDVEAKFDVSFDVSAAGRCLALEEWTASVFHCMRVLEIGLVAFHQELKLPPRDRPEWNELLADIDNERKRLREMNRAIRPPMELLDHYDSIASSFRSFRGAWRNHVMHSRSNYTEKEAPEIYAAVKSFMKELAS